MSTSFPLAFASDEWRLMTAIVIGGAFGFALERGGFGNARKLAAQFYLNDMTVLKVMFTAIIVAMTGIYTLAGLGMVDLSRVYIPETFLWAQLVGGFMLGVGFIMSGLCPGTSLVSAASGRIDAMVALGGVFIGTWLFGATVDWFPGLKTLFDGGALGVSTLPSLLHLPAWVLVIAVLVMAAGAFVGAERVERAFQKSAPVIELTPPSRPPYKFALGGALLLVLVVGTAARRAPAAAPPIVPTPIEPMALAERIIARDPMLVLLDLRGPEAEKPIPGAAPVGPDSSALGQLADIVPGRTVVVVYDATGTIRSLPGYWPDAEYRYVAGGRAGWERDVVTPAVPASPTLEERERIQLQNQVAAYFSGATVKAAVSAPPVAGRAGGVKKKKPGGGC